MTEETYIDQEIPEQICYVNAKTRPLFRDMLNQVGSVVKVGINDFKYGDAIYQLDRNLFDSTFNRWVTKCCEKNLMVKTEINKCTKHLKWNEDFSEAERIFKSMEVLKEII